jgi:hypothetical protein
MSEQITPEQIAAFRQQRVRECGEKLAALLTEYNCDLIATPQIVDGRIVAVVQIVSKD